MKIHVLFMQRKEGYPGEFGPEAVAAIDEFTLDENPAAWNAEMNLQREKNKQSAVGFAEVQIRVDQDEIRRRCLGITLALKGQIDG